jgi:hypothetical protein
MNQKDFDTTSGSMTSACWVNSRPPWVEELVLFMTVILGAAW